MKELQEIDIDAAPLLFHAASSRSEHCCFQTAYNLIYRVLGKGGVVEQISAADGLGRRILMLAARSNHIQVFKDAVAIYKETVDEIALYDHSESSTTRLAETEQSTSSAVLLKTGTDINGMNCLHHAAQAGCCEVLREVIEMYLQAGGIPYLQQEVVKKDKNGRNPIMYVLRDGELCGEKEHACGRNDLEEKFKMLFKHAEVGWMKATNVLPQREPVSEKTEATQTTAVTELMHAARGGLRSLELALNNPLPASVEDNGLRRTVWLHKALDVKVKDNGRWNQTGDTETWGMALLLAAAAKLGDVNVLFHVVDAIKVSPKRSSPNCLSAVDSQQAGFSRLPT